MGRKVTGYRTAEGAMRLDIRTMIRDKTINPKQKIRAGSWEWTGGGSISFIIVFSEREQYMRLMYTTYSRATNQSTEVDYKVYFDYVKSNLGKGHIMYFLCPYSSRRCKVLYKCNGSNVFKSRFAYNKPILYRSQTTIKRDKYNTAYFKLIRSSEYKRLEAKARDKKHAKKYYKGNYTKWYKRFLTLRNRLKFYDLKRCQVFAIEASKLKYFALDDID